MKINVKIKLALLIACILLIVTFSIHSSSDKQFIEWKPVDGAKGYRVEIKNKDTGKVILETNVKKHIYFVDLPKGNYEFRIAVLNIFQKPVVWSYWNQLHVIYSHVPNLDTDSVEMVKTNDKVKIQLKGKYFQESTEIFLRQGTKLIPIENYSVKNSKTINIELEAKELEPGIYDIVLENPGDKKLEKTEFLFLSDSSTSFKKKIFKKDITIENDIGSADINVKESKDKKSINVDIANTKNEDVNVDIKNKAHHDTKLAIKNTSEGNVNVNVENKSEKTLTLDVHNKSENSMTINLNSDSKGPVDVNVDSSSTGKVDIKKDTKSLDDSNVKIENKKKENVNLQITGTDTKKKEPVVAIKPEEAIEEKVVITESKKEEPETVEIEPEVKKVVEKEPEVVAVKPEIKAEPEVKIEVKKTPEPVKPLFYDRLPDNYKKLTLVELNEVISKMKSTCPGSEFPDPLIYKCYTDHLLLNQDDEEDFNLYNFIRLSSTNYFERLSAYKYFRENCISDFTAAREFLKKRYSGDADEFEKYWVNETIVKLNNCKK